MDITPKRVMELREKTGAGMMDCKRALIDSDGDFEKAIKVLREKGLSQAAKRAGKETKEGCIFSYMHPGSKIGVRTCKMACWISLSWTLGMPKCRSEPSGLGMDFRRAGDGS